jgi:polar amino acid transport system substrate-binding protein
MTTGARGVSGQGKWSAVVRTAAILTGTVLLAGAAGCAAASPLSATAAQARNASGRGTVNSTTDHAARRAVAQAHDTAACNPAASSLRPAPGPPQVTPGSFMAKILARGYLIAGVSQSTYNFGYFDPLTGQTKGFDIDMIHAVAQAIFGNPNKVEFRGITDDQREPDIRNGSVDIVAETMTILCNRLKKVDFSSVYFEANTRVLVLKNSTATGLASLGGQKVCATAGSDSAGIISSYPVTPRLVLVTPPQFTDCLVLLQQGQVAAVSTDDAILAGLHAQDPFTKVVGPLLAPQPYGLAIAKQHRDFVRFVNAVLAQDEADGGWAASYVRWVGSPAPTPPTAQYAD